MSSKTYAELAVATSLQGGDLLATFRGIGPLKSLTASLAKDYFQTGVVLADGSVAMTGALAAYVGSESLPGIAFNGDTDTGIYRISANTLGIATGGVLRATFSSAGITGTFIGNITGNVTGNADTATRWATARNLSLTGDGTATLSSVDGSAAVSAALTLATVNANVGSFGDGSHVSTVTVNAKGLVTAASSTAISITDANLSAAVGVAKGGTGDTSLTSHGVLIGQGTSPVAVTAAGTVAFPLVSGGASADPAFALLTVPGGGLGAGTFTDGGVLIGNGTGVVQATSAGTAGQLLTSNGPGVDPTFQTFSPGLVLLHTLTASSSATLDDTTSITSTYDAYQIELENVTPATSSVGLALRFGTGAGPTYQTTGYSNANSETTYVNLGQGVDSTAANGGISGVFFIMNPNSATRPKIASGQLTFSNTSPALLGVSVAGGWVSNTVVTALRFLFTSGNIASGKIRIYGMRTS